MEYRLKGCLHPWASPLRGIDLARERTKEITHALVFVHPFPFGRIVVQIKRMDISTLWWYELTIAQPCFTSFHPYNCAFSLHFGIKNNLVFPLDGGDVKLAESTVSMIYMRNLTCGIYLSPGRYVFCQIDYSQRYLDTLTDKFPAFAKTVARAERTLGCSLQRNELEISRPFRKLLDVILACSTTKRRLAKNATESLLEEYLRHAQIGLHAIPQISVR